MASSSARPAPAPARFALARLGLALARLGLALALGLCAGAALAQRISDVRNTKHNLSVTGSGTVKATSESQICVFCHTPHAATQGVTPLWNRQLSNQTYTTYTSSSLDANAIQGALDQPGGSSKLCLSCHDGTLAIGNVNVLNGQPNQTIGLTGTGPGGVMAPGSGTTTGFTRSLGADLTNDHPISLSFTSALATRDGELRPVDGNQKWPAGSGTVIGVRTPGYRPLMPLEATGSGGTGQIQCATCHDPHIRETDTAKGNQKFLRANRFQEATPSAAFSETNDIVCLACHDKNGASGVWAYSSHANPQVATQTYTPAAAAQREFPASLPVWKAACLNCHDTHTVQGARRLLREATDSLATPKAGGSAALEEACYACHTTAATSAVTPVTTVPDIRSDFQLARRMPIRSVDQAAGSETHDIGGGFSDAGFVDCSGASNQCGKDLLEQRANLGAGNLTNRHAECSDCHNPHRVVKFRSFAGKVSDAGVLTPGLGATPDSSGTHLHLDAAGYTHSNIISGVLRGAWGVEPIYGSASFQSLPTGYVVKRGDPGSSSTSSVIDPYVTREYQICLKCHSDYGFSDNNTYPTGNRPDLGYPGGTPAGTNNLNQYTNVAREVQAPAGHMGEVTTTDSGAGASYSTNNHRSWHPVMDQTGRANATRGTSNASWRLPWRNAVGSQTMYCTDCHGSGTSATSVIPTGGDNGNPWGPHGSGNNFLLKGEWSGTTGGTCRDGNCPTADNLCFKCHESENYATRNPVGGSGFSDNGGSNNWHGLHVDRIQRIRCSWCHVAVPHGWKNKAFLVNLNDVGPEGGLAAGTQVRNNTTAAYDRAPYYMNALLKIRTFRASGQWTAASCGSAGAPGNGDSGKNWMRDSNENCKSPP